MTPSQSVTAPRPFVLVPLAAAAILGLAACSSGEPDSERAAGPTSAAPTTTAPATPAASPSPSMPVPADGEDRRACADDGSCEIKVTGPVTIPMPDRLGLGPIEVTEIGARDVAFVAPLTGSRFASSGDGGGCSATFTGPGAGTSARMDVTCPPGGETVVNTVTIGVVGIEDGAAVIRIRPAA
ncbi:hypothetical protein AB0L25_26840 [Spirillospora sp. NPDC052242]